MKWKKHVPTVICSIAIVFAFVAYLRSDKGNMGILRLQYQLQDRVEAVDAANKRLIAEVKVRDRQIENLEMYQDRIVDLLLDHVKENNEPPTRQTTN